MKTATPITDKAINASKAVAVAVLILWEVELPVKYNDLTVQVFTTGVLNALSYTICFQGVNSTRHSRYETFAVYC